MHLHQHYDDNAKKTWLKCDFNGCSIKPKTPMLFIRHISTHTHDKPYKCNIKINGKKCQHATGYKHTMKKHWNTHFEINENNNNNNNNNNINESDFEKDYYVSVNCHICASYFNDIIMYQIHLRQHYDNEDNRTWLICDIAECGLVLPAPSKFIAHISTHTNHKPYKCNIITNGIKCSESRKYKYEMKNHWKTHNKNKDIIIHNKKKKKKKNSKYGSM
eukprot:543636_1